MNTPETKHPNKPVEYFGEEASRFTKRMVEGKKVRFEFDRQQKSLVIYLIDGVFVNAEIVKQGYGHAYTKYPFKFLEEFRRYEREALENKMGPWK